MDPNSIAAVFQRLGAQQQPQMPGASPAGFGPYLAGGQPGMQGGMPPMPQTPFQNPMMARPLG